MNLLFSFDSAPWTYDLAMITTLRVNWAMLGRSTILQWTRRIIIYLTQLCNPTLWLYATDSIEWYYHEYSLSKWAPETTPPSEQGLCARAFQCMLSRIGKIMLCEPGLRLRIATATHTWSGVWELLSHLVVFFLERLTLLCSHNNSWSSGTEPDLGLRSSLQFILA